MDFKLSLCSPPSLPSSIPSFSSSSRPLFLPFFSLGIIIYPILSLLSEGSSLQHLRLGKVTSLNGIDEDKSKEGGHGKDMSFSQRKVEETENEGG